MEEDSKHCTVTRDGKPMEISNSHLVVGDIIKIRYGQQIPADCLVIKANSLLALEAAITGEGDDIRKDVMRPITQQEVLENYGRNYRFDPFLYEGSFCTSGDGEALVLAVGDNTLFSGSTMPALSVSGQN